MKYFVVYDDMGSFVYRSTDKYEAESHIEALREDTQDVYELVEEDDDNV